MPSNIDNTFLAKDFIETAEGLVFAVVECGLEEGNILCFLRYAFIKGQWKKQSTKQANQLLQKSHPQFLHYSSHKQAHCHAVTPNKVIQHHRPRHYLSVLLNKTKPDSVEQDAQDLCRLYKANGLNLTQIGITGSVLIAAQNYQSDIDLVFYDRNTFNQARQITQLLIDQKECSELQDKDWKESYDRRLCDLSYAEYLWHEKRKLNKALINHRKFDLSLVVIQQKGDSNACFKKKGKIVLKTEIVDDRLAFDYPAEFLINHQYIQSIICYTATYSGQAKKGETIEVSGLLEESNQGGKRIVVGSTREAKGEYIKVIHE